MGLPQVKAAGLVQVFDLPRLQHRGAPCAIGTGCATSCHARNIVARLASPTPAAPPLATPASS
ncbi:MAG: hypothetical protein IJJ83_05390 [Muribaculaceae bacterium]|nr:hypothetical protein [Muribaculaceae bacterium]